MPFGRKKPSDSAEQPKPQKQKPKGTEVAKSEISDGKLKFYAAKGLTKKRWVAVREIPVLEIEKIEKTDNELNVTWRGATESFFTMEQADLFSPIIEKVNGMKAEKQKTDEQNEKATLRKNEIIAVVNVSMPVIDASFDILIGLQEKHIDWQQIDGYAKNLGQNLTYIGQTIPPLNLDFSKIADAVKAQVPKEASREAFNVLKAAYGYFTALNPGEDAKDDQPNYHTAKTLIHAYFVLNDLLLGKIVGDKENAKEMGGLEADAATLTQANMIVDPAKLKKSIDAMNAEAEKQTIIEECRTTFKELLSQLGKA